MSIFAAALRQSGLGDIFQSGSTLANLGVLGILGALVIVLSWVAWRAYQREIERSDKAMAGWAAATTQFERSLDLVQAQNETIKEMQNRRRGDDR